MKKTVWLAGFLMLLAVAARAEEKDAFYDAALGNVASATGTATSIPIDVRGKATSAYVRGVDGTAAGSFRVECSYTNSAVDEDWSACSADYTIAGTAQIALDVCRTNWIRIRIVTLTLGTVTGHFTLELP